ncbi:hypothetical protein [Pseudarthrobacter sp. Y6]|uniref:hypothetical protein n=1 Tax=Pseudarthrobacter sp. Y6 TaxID=3418422 RepID=UPI003CF99F1E
MAATASKPFGALLLRAGLLTGLLAVIAGIFGMHLMSGAHTMPAAASAGTDMPLTQIQGSHADHGDHPAAQSAATGASAAVSGTASACAAHGSCPSMSAMDAVCVLSPASTSLSAPLPGTTPFPALDVTGGALVTTSYSYLPGSPSPGDLCISRT